LYNSSCTHYNLCIQTVRIFRKCITCFRFRRWHALHTFIEAFQGQYKDGTDGTQDFRIVSALYLIFRTAALLAHLISNHGRGTCNHAYVWLAAALILASTSLFFAVLKPYKVNYLNAIDSLLLFLPSVQLLLVLFLLYLPNQKYSHVIGMSSLLITGIPHAVLMLYILYVIFKKMRVLQCLNGKCQCLLSMVDWKKHSLAEANSQSRLVTDSLPDRLVNPEEYEPLIPAVNQQRTENYQNESFTAQARVTPTNTYGIID